MSNRKKSLLSNSLSKQIISNNGAFAIMLCTLSAHLKGGFCSPFSLGFSKPPSAVFLCPQKITSIMVGWFGNSKELPFLNAVCKPESTRHQIFCSISGGLNLQSLGVTAMSVISILNELKAEVQALKAEIAALKAEKSIQNNTIAAVQAVQSVDHSKPKHDRIIRLPEALKITGFKKTSFYAKLKQGLFKKIKLGERSVGFFESEIYAFVQSLPMAGGVA